MSFEIEVVNTIVGKLLLVGSFKLNRQCQLVLKISNCYQLLSTCTAWQIQAAFLSHNNEFFAKYF
jgi:hypothetical protein